MNILYATDGSNASRAAAALLTSVARRSGTSIVVVSVAEDPLFPEAYFLQPGLTEELTNHHRRLAQQAADELESAGFTVEAEVLTGRPGPSIVGSAESGYDLVVAGAGNHSWLGRLLLGSVSTHVLHSAAPSVLVVHESLHDQERVRVLLATDGSASAEHAADIFSRLADPSKCQVTVLSVARMPSPMVLGYPYASVVDLGTEMLDELVAGARKIAQDTAQVLRDAGFDVTAVALDGAPSHLILEEAEKGGYGLVVLGTHGRGVVRRTVLGSVSDAVVRHAHAALVGRTAPEPYADVPLV